MLAVLAVLDLELLPVLGQRQLRRCVLAPPSASVCPGTNETNWLRVLLDGRRDAVAAAQVSEALLTDPPGAFGLVALEDLLQLTMHALKPAGRSGWWVCSTGRSRTMRQI